MRVEYILIVLYLFSNGCKESTQGVPQEAIVKDIPAFHVDSAYLHIVDQLAFGKREMNSSGHEACKTHIAAKLRSYDFEVQLQEFEAKAYTGEILHGTNIQGIHNPKVRERVLLCAHYDTRHIADKDSVKQNEPIDGADDGASAVAVLLEIARLVSVNQLPMGVDIVFFDAEDHGSPDPGNDYSWGLGSQHWSKEIAQSSSTYKYGILLDMVGSKNATFRKEGFSMNSAPKQVNQIWNLAQRMGKEKFFVNQSTGFMTDDHRFIIENTSIPMLDIINVKRNGAFGHFHHRHSDNIEIIDKETLHAVGQVVIAHLFRESNGVNN